MKGRKIILLAAACGAVIGALVARQGGRGLLSNIPAFAPDKALLTHARLYWIAVIGWVMFSLYWEVAAKGAAPTKRSESRASRAIHVFLTNAALIMALAPIRGLGRFLPVSSLIMSAGLFVEAIGLFVAIWARRHLGQNWSGEITIKVEHELVRSGPYRWLRHPIYTGILAMYVGGMLVTGERLAIVGLAMIAVAYWRKILLEEANMQMAFGAEYDAYRRETWVLVPGLL
jgi:protein-S-isoprenylcysteine O-methyltransferase Ste14